MSWPSIDHAPGVRADQPEEVPEEHRLAAAGPPDDDHQLGRRDLEVDAAEHRLAAEALAERLDPDRGGWRTPSRQHRAQEVVEHEDQHRRQHDRLGRRARPRPRRRGRRGSPCSRRPT